MRLSFHGASHTVTGSCFLLESGNARILIDCGMFQGSKTEKELNYREFPFDPARIDAVVLTHAHIDHSGLLPKLVKHGFKGPIHATQPTADLCTVMLPDSARIQEMEVEQLNRRNRQRGQDEVQPIYVSEDAQTCLDQFVAQDYATWVQVAPNFRIRFWNAGHLLGSASVEAEVTEHGAPTILLFSGDIGTKAKLLQRDPQGPSSIDHLICESTYGDTERLFLSESARRGSLRHEVLEAAKRGGALLIPSFAVERTQELIADLVALMDAKEIPDCPIFIDSPMATRASEVFKAHTDDVENGPALLHAMTYRNVHFTESVEQSKAIGRFRGFHIILSASGMCEAGRIRHHLKNWLWRDDGTILMVGFQAQGTLGRILQEGASVVRIMGEQIRVAATIRTLDVYSGHADAKGLMEWIMQRLPVRGQIFLVHGEELAIEALKGRLAQALPDQFVAAPTIDQCFSIEGVAVTTTAGGKPRLAAEGMGHRDWHNDLSRLILDIDDAIRREADEKNRAVLMRRLRKALEA
jgi:metallo-beta-lactamase family protein